MQKGFLDNMTPNEFLLNRTYTKFYSNIKRDQSLFDNELCKKQLNTFVEGLVQQDAWALKSEIIVIVSIYLQK